MSNSNPHTEKKLSAAHTFAPKTGPLGEANAGFHESYNLLVRDTLPQLGAEIPVIAVMGSHLKFLFEGSEQSELLIPDRYHDLKALSHIAFGIQLTLMANGDGPLTEATAELLPGKVEQIEHVSSCISDLPEVEQGAPAEILRLSKKLVEKTLEARVVDESLVTDYAREAAPLVLQNAAFAVRLELDRMHEVVSGWRQAMGQDKWENLYVVVCGGHQPRYRDAARQYFERLLHEQEGLGAELEDRVLYGEGIRDVDGVKDLLARHIIDQRASVMFFDCKNRLQEDLLADVAAEYLKELLPNA